jgi:hypothetical protein
MAAFTLFGVGRDFMNIDINRIQIIRIRGADKAGLFVHFTNSRINRILTFINVAAWLEPGLNIWVKYQKHFAITDYKAAGSNMAQGIFPRAWIVGAKNAVCASNIVKVVHGVYLMKL